MRKFLSFLMAALMLLGLGMATTACSDDEDEETASGSIVGTWQFKAPDGTTLTYHFSADGTCWQRTTYTDGEEDYSGICTYKYDGHWLAISSTEYEPSEDEILYMEVTVSGNSLIVKDGYSTIVMTRIG